MSQDLNKETNQPTDTSEVEKILLQNGWKPDTDVEDSEAADTGPKPIDDGDTDAPEENERSEFDGPKERDRIRRMPAGIPETVKPQSDPWSRTSDKTGKVTVNTSELEAYTKALLFDTRFELGVPLYLGETPVSLVFRSLYVAERDIMALALKRLADDHPIQTMSQAALMSEAFLKMSLICQLVSIDGVGQDPFDARPIDDQLPEESDKVEKLYRLTRTRYQGIHQAKLQMLIRGITIFDIKQKILEDSYYNQDFPRPVDAS